MIYGKKKYLIFGLGLLFLSSCEKEISLFKKIEFETPYTETIEKGEDYSDHPHFRGFKENYVKATINFDASNLYGSLGTGCDGDFNKTMGLQLPGSSNPHDNSGRFVHRVSEDLSTLELGYYVHRKGYLYTQDDQGQITDSSWVDELLFDHIMDIETEQDYLVEVLHEKNQVKFFVDNVQVQSVEMPNKPEGNYHLLHFYHGGDCPAPESLYLDITYHHK